MKYFVLIMTGILLLLTSCTNESVLPSTDEAKDVIMGKVNNAALLWASGDGSGYSAMASTDITYMDDLASPDLIVGKEKFEEYIEQVGANVPAHKPVLSAFNWQFYDEIVILTYRYQGDFDGQLAPAWRITSVFRYENEEWLSVHENWSLVKEPEPEEVDTEPETEE